MIGYVCRCKNSDTICVATGRIMPESDMAGWFNYIPGWYASFSIRTFKRRFGFSVKPGTIKKINIDISERK